MSKSSIQELVNKFNSKNPLDKTKKAQKEKDPQFINKMSNIINNQNKTNDKKLLTSSLKNSDIKKEKVDEKEKLKEKFKEIEKQKENNKIKDMEKIKEQMKEKVKEKEKEKTKDMEKNKEKVMEKMKEKEKEKTKDMEKNKEKVMEKIKENLDSKIKQDMIINKKENLESKFKQEMKMNLESKMKQDIAMNKKENIDLKNKQENIQEDPELPLQRDKKSYTISMHNPSILQKLQTITKKNAQIAKKKILNKLDLLNDDPYNFNEKDFIRRRYDKDNVDNGKKFFKLRFLKSKLDSLDSNENNINNNNTKSDDSQSNVEKERCLRQYNSDFILTLEKSILSFNVKNYKDSYEILLNSRIIRNIKEYGEFLLVVGGFDKFLIGEFIAKQKYPNDKKEVLNNFIESINMKDSDLTFLDCLRFLFTRLNLPKDANLILEIMDKFSVNYFEVNKQDVEFVEIFKSSDKIYLLVSTILALNTMFTRKDIKIKNVIKKEEFIKMNEDLSKEYLDKLYDELKKNPISITIDDKIESIYKKLASLAGEGVINEPEEKSAKSLTPIISEKNSGLKIEDKSEENSGSRLSDKLFKLDSDKVNDEDVDFVSNLKEEDKVILKTPQKFYKINRGKKSNIKEYVFNEDFTKLYYLEKPKKLLDILKLTEVFNGSEHSHNGDIIKYLKSNPSEEQFSNNFVSLIFENHQLDLMSDNLDSAMKWYKAVKNLITVIKNRNKPINDSTIITQFEKEIKESVETIWESLLGKWNIYGGYLMTKLMERNVFVNNASKNTNQIETKKLLDKNIKSFLKSIEAKLSKEKDIEYSDFINLYYIGLPNQTRKSLWQILIGNSCGITKMTYEHNKRKIPPIDFKSLNLNDPDKTFSSDVLSNQIIQEIIKTNEIFAEEESGKNMDMNDVMNKVYNIARSFFFFRQDLSFNKNLISIIYIMLFAFQEEDDTFINIVNLISANLFSIFIGDEDEIKSYSDLFNILLEKYIPKISKQFGKMEITPELYLIPWLEEFFTKTFNINILNHIFDLFLINGEYILFQIGLSIIKLLEDELPNSTIGEIFKSLQRIPKHTTETDFMYIVQSFDKVKKDVWEWKSQNELGKQKINLCNIIYSS